MRMIVAKDAAVAVVSVVDGDFCVVAAVAGSGRQMRSLPFRPTRSRIPV